MYSTVQCNTTQCNAIHCSVSQYNTVHDGDPVNMRLVYTEYAFREYFETDARVLYTVYIYIYLIDSLFYVFFYGLLTFITYRRESSDWTSRFNLLVVMRIYSNMEYVFSFASWCTLLENRSFHCRHSLRNCSFRFAVFKDNAPMPY